MTINNGEIYNRYRVRKQPDCLAGGRTLLRIVETGTRVILDTVAGVCGVPVEPVDRAVTKIFERPTGKR